MLRKKIAALFLLMGTTLTGFEQVQLPPNKQEDDAPVNEINQSTVNRVFGIRSIIMAGATTTARAFFAISNLLSGPAGPEDMRKLKMLTEAQEKYLESLPEGEIVLIQPFDPKAQEAGLSIVRELESALPGLPIVFGGAAALGIAGQNDIDINILSTPADYNTYEPLIEKLYSPPAKRGTSIKWNFKRDGFDVELYLTDKDSPGLQEQIRVFELLKNSPELRAEYEQVKMPLGPIDFKDYMRKKYAFFNRILGQE